MLENNRGVKLFEDTHQYFDKEGIELCSAGRFLDRFKKKFDTNGISIGSATKALKLSGIKNPSGDQVAQKAQELQASWKNDADTSNSIGNRIHNALELFSKTTKILPENKELEGMIRSVFSLFKNYKESWNEKVLYYEQIDIAGTADKPLYRGNNTIDVCDYKTNAKKGIQYDSPYGNFFTGPVSHLEDCNYNRYALQLSLYAHMIETTWQMKIGKLFILFIPPSNPMAHFTIAVPYMKHEIEMMLKFYLEEMDPEPAQEPEQLKSEDLETHVNPFL